MAKMLRKRMNVEDFTVWSFYWNSPDLELQQEGEADLNLSNDFQVMELDGGLLALEHFLSLSPSSGAYYSVECRTWTVFSVPFGMTDAEIEEFLSGEGSETAYRNTCEYLRNATENGPMGPVELPEFGDF